jgi:hypothetical protein
MNQTTAGQLYNNHVKEALQSGKPVELSMKDFLPKQDKKNKIVIHKKADQGELKMTIEELEAARQGNKEKEFENWKQSQPYEILISKITGKEYVCNLPR